jgi:hypothetical protein
VLRPFVAERAGPLSSGHADLLVKTAAVLPATQQVRLATFHAAVWRIADLEGVETPLIIEVFR